MSDFFEIDFLAVEAKKSGDAIPLRYQQNGVTSIHVVDGGFTDTGESVVAHIRKHYNNPTRIDRVVVTHPDRDHACGLQAVLEGFQVGELWMLRPWNYAAELLPRFERYTSVGGLSKRLRECYPYVSTLEEIANRRGIPIYEPFQGSTIGAFTVLAPTRARYLDLIVSSEKTPESVEEANKGLGQLVAEVASKALAYLRAAWGDEAFSPNETSAENEMSVIQFASLCEERILLTGDAGRVALSEAADFAPQIGLSLPGIQRFQVPHHGSRRNVSSEVLDRWLGSKLGTKPEKGTYSAIISSAKADPDHPRKAVVRALNHRGANVYATEGRTVCSYKNSPAREGWSALQPDAYPDDQEQD
jgi:beta-lactamase superfamily II metal-dependent hydrolase